MNNWNKNILEVLKNCLEQSFEEYIKKCIHNHDSSEIIGHGEGQNINDPKLSQIFLLEIVETINVHLVVKTNPCYDNPGKNISVFLFSMEDSENNDKTIYWEFDKNETEKFIENYKNIDISDRIIKHLKHIQNSGCMYLCNMCDGMTQPNEQGLFICPDCEDDDVPSG